MIGSLLRLARVAAIQTVLDGTEAITKATLEFPSRSTSPPPFEAHPRPARPAHRLRLPAECVTAVGADPGHELDALNSATFSPGRTASAEPPKCWHSRFSRDTPKQTLVETHWTVLNKLPHRSVNDTAHIVSAQGTGKITN